MPKWNQFTEKYLSRLTNSLKRKRVEQFVRMLSLGPSDVVLDLGSEDGSFLASYYPYPHNIILADLSEGRIKSGVERHGLKDYLVLPADGPIPARDRAFDAVWCNSVIEHVTVDRGKLSSVTTRQFRHRADDHQRRFAREIERVACKFLVQTPYLFFPVEAHSWIPGVQFTRHETHMVISRLLKKYWIKQWTADFYLYNWPRFREHFRGASAFFPEKVLGLTKSLIAVRA